MIGVGFYNSAAFFTYEYSKRFFKRFKERPEDLLPMQYVVLSGMATGLPSALIIVFLGLFKISNSLFECST